MKIIILTLKRLIDLFVNEKLTCSLFLVSFVVTITSFFYFYGLYNGIKLDQEKVDLSTRSYMLKVQNTENPREILKLISDGNFFKPEMIKILSGVQKKNNKKYIFTSSYPKNIKYFIAQGRYFNEDELKSNSNLAIIGSKLIDSQHASDYIGKKITINNHPYKCIGIDSYFDNTMVTIPFNTFLKENFKIDNISFIIDEKTSKDKVNIFEQHINSIGTNAVLVKPKDVNYDIVASFISRLMMAILVITLTVINILYLFNYLVEKRKKEYFLMKICGATSIKTIITVLIELLVFIAIGYFIALVAYLGVLRRTIENMHIKLEYSLIDYPIIFLIITLITIISALPTINKCRNTSSVLSLKN